MSVVTSGTVTQSASGAVATFLDTSTGVSGLISRVLVITNSNNVVLQTTNMGATLTATFAMTADLYLTFTETITDGSGTYILTINYLSTAFYDNTYVNTITQLGCGCQLSQFNFIDISYFFRQAALRLALGGFAVAAQSNITAANTLISGS